MEETKGEREWVKASPSMSHMKRKFSNITQLHDDRNELKRIHANVHQAQISRKCFGTLYGNRTRGLLFNVETL